MIVVPWCWLGSKLRKLLRLAEAQRMNLTYIRSTFRLLRRITIRPLQTTCCAVWCTESQSQTSRLASVEDKTPFNRKRLSRTTPIWSYWKKEEEEERQSRREGQKGGTNRQIYNTYKCITYGGNTEAKFSWSVGSGMDGVGGCKSAHKRCW